jgi:hypothetical protein
VGHRTLQHVQLGIWLRRGCLRDPLSRASLFEDPSLGSVPAPCLLVQTGLPSIETERSTQNEIATSAADSTTVRGLGTALVTGATSGIGRATALHLASDGCEVIVHGRNPDRGAEVVGEIEAQGGRARFVAADLTDVAAVRALVDEVGDLDVLVNNAGASWFGPTGGRPVP